MKLIRIDRILLVLAVGFGFSTSVRAESLAAIFTNAQTQAVSAARPSIIFIRCHGLGYGDLSCYGQTNFSTPNLDRLATGGIRFTDFQPGSPDFSGALAALMTGKNRAFAPGTTTLADRLQQAGYHTGLIGEWTLGTQPWNQGFNEFAGFINEDEARNYFADHMWRYAPHSLFDPTNHIMADYTGNEMIYDNMSGRQGKYLPDLLMAAVESFTQIHKPDQFNHYQPFFLLADFPAPQSAVQGTDDFPVPTDAPFSDEPWPQAAKNRVALITRIDGNIGSLLEELTRLEMTNNVVIIFSSSAAPEKFAGHNLNFLKPNGDLAADKDPATAPLPMIVYGPGVIATGHASDATWSSVDFMPTMLELAQVRPVPKCDGASIVPVLMGQVRSTK